MRSFPTPATITIPRRWTVLCASALLSLAGCAATPAFDTQGVDRSITPSAAKANPKAVRGKRVLWGGVIIATTNLEQRTQIEMLAYPLDGEERPQLSAKPLGRVLVEKSGYLEPVDYAQGRQITALGSLQGTQDGRVGQSQYTYPVLKAQQVHLWAQRSSGTRTHFNFGIGVIFH